MLINIFGDSHCRYFKITIQMKHAFNNLKKINSNVNVIIGASVVGLGRRESVLETSKLIENKISNEAINVFCFGQVDIELGYWYKRIIKKQYVNEKKFIINLVDSYIEYIKSLDINLNTVVIKGVNLTVLKQKGFSIKYVSKIISENIQDKSLHENYLNKLREIYFSEQERNAMMIHFNTLLSQKAKENQLHYFDINDILCNYNLEEGVSNKFTPAVYDHHIVDSIETRIIHWNKLLYTVGNLSSQP